jgi:hypothetical protein
MISVWMGKHHGIQLSGIRSEHLIPEVWCGINHHRCSGGTNFDTGS